MSTDKTTKADLKDKEKTERPSGLGYGGRDASKINEEEKENEN